MVRRCRAIPGGAGEAGTADRDHYPFIGTADGSFEDCVHLPRTADTKPEANNTRGGPPRLKALSVQGIEALTNRSRLCLGSDEKRPGIGSVMATGKVASEVSKRPRIEPSVRVGIVVVLVYMAVVNGIQISTGIDYNNWFDTAHNAVRAAIIPLAVANVLLFAFVLWARWDIFWRDPERLPMSRLAKAIIALFGLTVLARLVSMDWPNVPGDLLLAILATGVLVGLAEELLFRGTVLRCLRTAGRPESLAAFWTAVAFGLFHLPNIFLGTGLTGLWQITLAAITGYALYLFRRWQGFIWMAMAAHGLWDISAFLTDNYASSVGSLLGLALNVVLALVCLAALIRSLRTDRGFMVTPAGVVPVAKD